MKNKYLFQLLLLIVFNAFLSCTDKEDAHLPTPRALTKTEMLSRTWIMESATYNGGELIDTSTPKWAFNKAGFFNFTFKPDNSDEIVHDGLWEFKDDETRIVLLMKDYYTKEWSIHQNWEILELSNKTMKVSYTKTYTYPDGQDIADEVVYNLVSTWH